MKKLSLLLFLTAIVASTANAQTFAGGSGTEEDPYQVENVDQLRKIRYHTDEHFIQIADIDASDTENWNKGKGFEPIGDLNNPFSGNYNGDGHVISNLHINRPKEKYVGLFGVIQAKIENLGLKNVKITGEAAVGSLVGFSDHGIIGSVFATGEVTGDRGIGGLVGRHGTVEGPIGIYGHVISSSYTHVQTSGNNLVGGLVGVVGVIGLAKMDENYVYSSHAIEQAYSKESVSGEDYTGGVIGRGSGLIEAYWDYVISRQARGAGNQDEYEWLFEDLQGLATDQMTGQDAYIHMYRLDFDETWQLVEDDYPVLQWQEPEDATDPPEVAILRTDRTSHDFGEVVTEDRDTARVAVANTGKVDLDAEISLGGENPESFIVTEGELTIAPGDTAEIETVFRPETEGSLSALLLLDHNAPNKDDPLEIELSGAGNKETSAQQHGGAPGEVELFQNYPNPFNPATQIRFELSESRQVTLEIYNIAGEHIRTLVEEQRSAGTYTVEFDASELAGGIYVYKLMAGEYSQSRTMIFLK